MSSFYCEHCCTAILDSENGYTTGCEHDPKEKKVTDERVEAIRLEFKSWYLSGKYDFYTAVAKFVVDKIEPYQKEAEENARLLGISGNREVRLLAELQSERTRAEGLESALWVIAKPSLGGKQQQFTARQALEKHGRSK